MTISISNLLDKLVAATDSYVPLSYSYVPTNYEIGSKPVGGTNTTIILASILGECEASNINLYKNGSSALTPTSPGSRLPAICDDGLNQENRCFNFVDTTSSLGDTYQLYIRSNSTASDNYHPNHCNTTSTNAPKGISSFTALKLSVGKGVLQAPVETKIESVSSTSVAAGAWHDPSLSCTITPTSATSKLLIVGNINLSFQRSAGQDVKIKLQRDGSDILVGDAAGSRTQATFGRLSLGSSTMSNIPIFLVVDSGSTSATTIKVLAGHGEASTVNLHINRSHTDSDSGNFVRGISQLAVYELEGV